jgi:large conductance mechanosensitive channel
MDFIKEYKVVGMAIAFVMGVATTSLIKSLVDNIIMPVITPFIPGGAWKTATFALGPIIIGWGAFLAELINFLIIAFVVFMIAKMVMKEEKVTKK